MANEFPIIFDIKDLLASQSAHEAELRAAESRRVDGRFDEVYNRMEHGFITLNEQVTAQVDRIDALITNSSLRADATAIKLEEGVTRLASSVAASSEAARKATEEATLVTSQTFDNRLKPLEDAMRLNAGRGSVLHPLLVAILGAGLAIVSGVITRLLFK